MAGTSGTPEDEPISTINMTPFVDIILVVLIIFMVTAPMIMKPSINVDLPEAASGEETIPDQLQVTIGKDGNTFLNGKAASEEEIGQYASNLMQTKPSTQAVISADKDVAHGKVISVIDTVKTAGVKRFAISIDKKL